MFGHAGPGTMLLAYALYALVFVGLPLAALVLVRRWLRARRPGADDPAREARLRAAEAEVVDLTLENARLEDEQRFTRDLLTPHRPKERP